MRNSSWKQYSIQQNVKVHRAGWLGVWDALISAATRKPRYAFTMPITISWWARHGANVVVNGIQVHISTEHHLDARDSNGH